MLRAEADAGRVEVCDEWRDFERFRADMGPRPQGARLCRPDKRAPYGPGNGEWLKPVSSMAEGVGPAQIARRRADGWCDECAATIPAYGQRKGCPCARGRRREPAPDEWGQPVNRELDNARREAARNALSMRYAFHQRDETPDL